MASIEQESKSKPFHIRFRHQGRSFKRSLKTTNLKTAEAILAQVVETIGLVDRGLLQIPPSVEPAKFLISGGRIKNAASKPVSTLTIGQLFERYENDLPIGSREPTTMGTEATHMKHFRTILNQRKRVAEVTVSDIQDYVNKRLIKRFKKRKIAPDTVKRELNTLAAIFNWARSQNLTDIPSPTKGIVFPKSDEKPPFMTREEILRRIDRGGLLAEEIKVLWSSLYLTLDEVKQLLKHVEKTNPHPVMYPLFCFAAFTGARRSEILRAQLDDLNLEDGTVLIREKKKSRSKSITFRRIDLPSNLIAVMAAWLKRHPGGNHLFTQHFEFTHGSARTRAITLNQMRTQFNSALKNSEWAIAKGWHLFRHSYASNLCSLGVSQILIDEFMGHQTEEMRRRYRHLFPKVRKKAVEHLAD